MRLQTSDTILCVYAREGREIESLDKTQDTHKKKIKTSQEISRLQQQHYHHQVMLFLFSLASILHNECDYIEDDDDDNVSDKIFVW